MRTVYIIGYDGDRWLPDCVGTIRNGSEEAVSLVVIDNYKNPWIETAEFCAVSARVVETPRKMGFADAHNFGIVAAPPDGDLVVLLNQDTKSGDRWLDRCSDAFSADPKLGVVMPGLRTYDDDGWDENFLDCARANPELMEMLESESGVRGEGRCFPVPVVTGAAMVVRTEVLWEVGLFDPIFESYYEDYDFCRRVTRAGWGIGIVPEARVLHFQGSATDSPEARRRRERWIARNRVIEKVRASGQRRGRVLLNHFLGETPRNLARGILRTPSSQSLRATLGAELDLLRLLPRLLSAEKDHAAWVGHLESIGWPTWAGGTRQGAGGRSA